MAKTIVLVYSAETRQVNELNQISRPGVVASGTWLFEGAVEYKFGRICRRYSADDARAGRVPWFYKNGKQRCFVADRDHGSFRVQMGPRLLDVKVVCDTVKT